MTKIVFRRASESELQEASAWYEEQEPGLGSKFVECADACVPTIRRHPEIFPVIYKQVRRGMVKRFPYSVLYFVRDESIIVISVFHSSRDPLRWKRRV